MSEYGVCVECQTKFNDGTIKPVSVCPICQRLVCSVHLRSALAYIPDFKHTGKALKEAQEIIKHDADGTGHSCLPYTMDYWKRFDLERERKRQQIKNAMNGFGYLADEEIEKTSDKSLEEIQKKPESINEQIIYCHSCGKKNRYGANFCIWCGKKISAPLPPKKKHWWQ